MSVSSWVLVGMGGSTYKNLSDAQVSNRYSKY